MAACPTRLIAALAWVLALGMLGDAALPAPAQSAQPASRIVSLVPAVTEILFAVGAGPQVVAVSSFDKFPPAVEKLTRVGALLNPDTERILSLRPNLVVVYGSQADLIAQFKQAGIPSFIYRHGGLSDTLDSITAVGAATGHAAGAARVVAGLHARLDTLRRRIAGRPKPRTLLVISREPRTLRGLYASGGIGFLHDLLELAGGSNVFADVREESVQPSQETLLTRRPDIVVELHPRPEMANAAEARRAWSPLASVPAVRANRVHPLGGAYLVTAGPRLGDAAETIARALHPEAFK